MDDEQKECPLSFVRDQEKGYIAVYRPPTCSINGQNTGVSRGWFDQHPEHLPRTDPRGRQKSSGDSPSAQRDGRPR